jgi:glycosyltransferase involved in cell wall biosynthesis
VKLSILIPVYNERRLLPELLLKLSKALPAVDKEVILVDDGSTDGTREWIATRSPARMGRSIPITACRFA